MPARTRKTKILSYSSWTALILLLLSVAWAASDLTAYLQSAQPLPFPWPAPIAALTALFAFLTSAVLRDRSEASGGGGGSGVDLEFFDLADPEQTAAFYSSLAGSMRRAVQEIYRSGRGFDELSDPTHVAEVLDATEYLLKRTDVQLHRLQSTSFAWSHLWAERFAELMQQYPDQLHVYGAEESSLLINVGLIDPLKPDPIVQLLIESDEGDRAAPASAIFIHGQRELALSLRRQFVTQIDSWKDRRLTPADFADPEGHGLVPRPPRPTEVLYFAYGSHLSYAQMKQRCPSAEPVGTGVLYDWEMDFIVPAPHKRGHAAGIRERPGAQTHGVLYRVSALDRGRLTDIERGGYRPVQRNIKATDSQTHPDALVFEPTLIEDRPTRGPDPEILELMLAGARAFGLWPVVKFLESRQAAASE